MYFIKARENGKNNAILYIVTIPLLLIVNALPSVIVLGLIRLTNPGPASVLYKMTSMTTPEGWVLQLISGLVSIGFLFFSIKIFHKRTINSLITASPTFRTTRLIKGATLWFVLCIIPDFITWKINPSLYQWTFTPENIPFILVMIPVIIILASFEELIFRGYLLQGFGMATRNKIAAIIITSFIFGSLHLINPEVKNYGALFIVPQYYLMGLFFAVLVLMENGLEMTLGIHIVNNLYGGIIVGFKGSVMPVPSLIKITEYKSEKGLALLILFIAVFLIIYSIEGKINNEKRLKNILQKIEI